MSKEQEFFNILVNIFPDCDPDYLQYTVVPECFTSGHPETKLDQKIDELLHKNYPSREEYIKRKKNREIEEQFNKKFDIEAFLKLFPDQNPKEFYTNQRNVSRLYKDHSAHYLELRCHILSAEEILELLEENLFNLYLSFRHLKNEGLVNQSAERKSIMSFQKPEDINLHFIQEVAYIEHEREIEEYLDSLKLVRYFQVEDAKHTQSLFSCGCCFEDEFLPSEVVTCTEGHAFCYPCVAKYAEVRLGQAECTIPCMNSNCKEGGEYSLKTLKTVMTPSTFSTLVRQKQLEEIKEAGIELDYCPFCDFSNMVVETDKLFVCLSDECRKVSCRLCKKENHAPLLCDTLENRKSHARKTIEEKLSSALIRACPKCGQKYVKSDGCNHISCRKCGTHMCYICRNVVDSKSPYKHFNGQGGTNDSKCPLFSDDSLLHVDAIVNVAKQAEAELALHNPDVAIDIAKLVPSENGYRGNNNQYHLSTAVTKRVLDLTLNAANKEKFDG